MNRRRHVLAVAFIAMMLAACGTKSADTNSADTEALDTTSSSLDGAANTTTTTEARTTTTVDEFGVEDLTPECVAAIAAVLHAFEPAVKDIDWEHATIYDHLQVMTDLAGTTIGDTSACGDQGPDLNEEAGAELFFGVAEQQVPGAVGYFRAVMDINKALGGRHSSGECQTDIATFEELVAGGVPWVNLPLPEQWLTFNLMYSIGYCTLQTQGALLSKPEVQVFLEGSPFT